MTTETTATARTAPLLPQLVKFGAVGAIGFVVNLIVFNVMLLIVLRGLPHASLYATMIATLVAIAANWVGNRFWAFAGQRQENATREGLEFFVVSLAGMGIPLVCVWVSHYVLGMSSPIADNIAANGVGLVLGMLFRFALYRWWVFSPGRDLRGQEQEKLLRVGAPAVGGPAPATASALARTPDTGLIGD